MKTSSEGISFIESWEKFSPIPYPDAGGRMTIGFGHLIQPGESTDPITIDEGTDLLHCDLICSEDVVNDAVNVFLSQSEFDALVSLCFNIGIGAFKNSTLVKLINGSNLPAAAQQFTRWDHINGQVSSGLLHRRQAEELIFTQGVYNNH